MGNCIGVPTDSLENCIIIPQRIQVRGIENEYEKVLYTICERPEEEDFYNNLSHIKIGDKYEKLRSEWYTICLNLKSD